jgi:predicted nuclease of predicted toxin-antitoxin system
MMSKDSDFIHLIENKGSPPKLIWVTCGNTSYAALKKVLSVTLTQAKALLESGETIVEISDK